MSTFASLLHLDGHGPYVWGAYAVTLLVMLLEPWLAARRRQRAAALVREHAEAAHAAETVDTATTADGRAPGRGGAA